MYKSDENVVLAFFERGRLCVEAGTIIQKGMFLPIYRYMDIVIVGGVINKEPFNLLGIVAAVRATCQQEYRQQWCCSQ
jgi:hypothetical protein